MADQTSKETENEDEELVTEAQQQKNVEHAASIDETNVQTTHEYTAASQSSDSSGLEQSQNEEDRATNVNDDDTSQHRHDPAEHIKNIKPWWIHKKIAATPILCCCLFFFCFVICGVIVVAVPNLLAFSPDIPFYIRDNDATQNKDAAIAARLDSSYLRQEEVNGNDQQQAVASDVTLQLVFSAVNGQNIAQKRYLELIDEIEDGIENSNGYTAYCRRLYQGRGTGFNIPYSVVEEFINVTFPNNLTFLEVIEDNPSIHFGDIDINFYNDSDDNAQPNYTCSRASSPTDFFDSSFFIPQIDDQYTLYPSVENLVLYMLPSLMIDGTVTLTNKDYSEENINSVLSYWAGYGRGAANLSDDDPYQQKYYDGKPMPAEFWMMVPDLSEFSNEDPNGKEFEYLNISVFNLFATLAGVSFADKGPLDTKVDILASIVQFGLPLDGYESASDRTDEQEDMIGKWCYDNLHETFVDFKKKHEDEILFNWVCGSMGTYYTTDILVQDGMFMLGTFASVYILMVYNTGSFWFASCGMMMIFLNFLPTMLLYRFISGQVYFGSLTILSMFIILSIGADDIFVLYDTWAQHREIAPNEPMEKRMTATLKHAGKVMATTSLSTIFSFLGNTTSVFPAVYTFGWFAAWLVFVNYCAVVLFYPTVLAVHDMYLYTPQLKRGWCCNNKCCKDNQKCCGMDNVKDLSVKGGQRPIDKFFEQKFFGFIFAHRKWILAITLIVFLTFFGFAIRIEPDPNLPQIYPENDNYQQYISVLSENYVTSNFFQLETEIVFGLDGINREGTEYTDPDDIGKPVYSKDGVSFSSPQQQAYVASFCDDLLCIYDDSVNCRYSSSVYSDLKVSDPDNYGGSKSNVLHCFMTEFRDWIESNTNIKPLNVTQTTQLLIDYNATNLYNASTVSACDWNTFPVQDEECFEYLFGLVWLNEPIPTSSPNYVPGNINYDYWKSYIYVKDSDQNGLSLRDMTFFSVSVLTEGQFTDNFLDGIAQFEHWQEYTSNWRDNVDGERTSVLFDTPKELSSVLVTEVGAIPIYSYYYNQKRIIREAVSGILISLGLAFLVLTFATMNWIIAAYSVFVIFVIVIFVIGFTVMNGWNLGIIEAIIYVMVVGMSVDYVVHLSEAYLHSDKFKREDRARDMLATVGSSVLSGALSTLIGIAWLLFATIVIFQKFGAFIFFLISVSVILSLVSFTAAMASFGPQGEVGSIGWIYRKCRKEKGTVEEQSNAQIQMSEK